MKKLAILFLLFTTAASAQKLPNKQQASVWAPANIKIDGRLSEWPNGLQAHNSIDGLFYTVANDENNLYLVIKAPYKNAFEKVLQDGITFTVSNLLDAKRKKDVNAKTILFPVLNNHSAGELISISRIYNNEKSRLTDKQLDSLLKTTNKKAISQFKSIHINGLRHTENATISVYNDLGIAACVQVNENMDYIYELRVPLKYLDISPTNTFSYNIKLNGATETRVIDYSVAKPTLRPGAVMPQKSTPYLDVPTDFWGEYTLAKAP